MADVPSKPAESGEDAGSAADGPFAVADSPAPAELATPAGAGAEREIEHESEESRLSGEDVETSSEGSSLVDDAATREAMERARFYNTWR